MPDHRPLTPLLRAALFASLALGLFLPTAAGRGDADSSAEAAAEFAGIHARIKRKLAGGERSADALVQEIAEIDALLQKYPAVNEETARIAHAKALLYLQAFGDAATGRRLLEEFKDRYAGTALAASVARQLQSAPAGAGGSALVGRPAPEIEFEWSSRPGAKKLSELKGRVVVLDFWATWCGPCVASFPQIRAKAERFRESPVSIIGVTNVQGRIVTKDRKMVDVKGQPEKERELLATYVTEMDMTWDVVMRTGGLGDGYNVRGIPHVTIIDPAGTVRFDKLHPMNEAKIEEAILSLLKEFNLPAPPPAK